MDYYNGEEVTPYAGVWIETLDSLDSDKAAQVTPYAGVWIETQLTLTQ